ncbi:alpha/beta hydrolase [Streptacidiphilus sp. EB129]|uniref:alpha/beta hydrolase n=1 Tax=Streptacidiphilus sp. EB129 TaxID=3156262 RepID=UPI00351160A8
MTDQHPGTAAVLLLPGGGVSGTARPRAWDLPSLRMRPFARAIGAALPGGAAGVSVVRYRHKGWNGERADAAADALRAVEAAEAAGSERVVLVGHSMGGRAALRAAEHPAVRGVVLLAPWCPSGEPVAQLAGRQVLVLHAPHDRVTSPAESLDCARRAREGGAAVCRMLVAHSDHAMLRHAGSWHAATAGLVAGLLGARPFPAEVAEALRLPGDSPEGLELPLPELPLLRP